jgi:hypothetical protein
MFRLEPVLLSIVPPADGDAGFALTINATSADPQRRHGHDHGRAPGHGHHRDDAPAGADNAVDRRRHRLRLHRHRFRFQRCNDSPAACWRCGHRRRQPVSCCSAARLAAEQFVPAPEIALGHLAFAPAANANGAGYATFTFRSGRWRHRQ